MTVLSWIVPSPLVHQMPHYVLEWQGLEQWEVETELENFPWDSLLPGNIHSSRLWIKWDENYCVRNISKLKSQLLNEWLDRWLGDRVMGKLNEYQWVSESLINSLPANCQLTDQLNLTNGGMKCYVMWWPKCKSLQPKFF